MKKAKKNQPKKKYEKPVLTRYDKIEKFFKGWAAPISAGSPAG